MNSIFLRIYGGMLAAMLLIALLAWGVVYVVDGWRADTYREQMARGTFWLMANSTGRYQGAEREQWLRILSALVGAPVTAIDEPAGSFSDRELRRLREGRVALRVEDDNTAQIFMRLPAEPVYITTRMSKVSEQHAAATVRLVLDELGRHPYNNWEPVFANVRSHFGYPLERLPLAQVRLDSDQQERLLRNEVVISLSEGSPSQEAGVRIYARIGSLEEVLVLGPLQLMEWRPLSIVIPVGALALLLMSLAAYLLVRPLERRLKSLEGAVKQVAAGNLAVRAEVRGSDAVGTLAASFNGMTAHIQRLILSQREMTRAVSHELRTPVARIRFALEMLAGINDPGERRQKVAAIDHDIDQLDELIDEILTYARLEEGVPSLDWEAVDVAALARRIAAELQPMAGTLRIEVEAPEVFLADGEARYLHRVLQNLVTNAIRYARGRIQLQVLPLGEDVELAVADDGPGIPAADREKVFKPFARLDDSRHRASGGYGLGLSIVQRIAEWHGGRAWVDEAPGGGARFHLRWPRRQAGSHRLSH